MTFPLPALNGVGEVSHAGNRAGATAPMGHEGHMRTGIIAWDEIDGAGTLTLTWDDGARERAEWSEPITSGTDSHEVAGQFGAFAAVSHDGKFIHVSRDQGTNSNEIQ